MANLSQNTGIVVLGIFSIFFPVLLLPFSLLLFRKSHKVAMFCFILFAFYFGWFYPLQLDLLVHYENFVRVAKFSFFKLYKDPETLYLGRAPRREKAERPQSFFSNRRNRANPCTVRNCARTYSVRAPTDCDPDFVRTPTR